MSADLITVLLGLGSGVLVGFALAATGGGGSILAVPLLTMIVGAENMHLAIGTSAVAVTINAATGLVPHARAHHVKWRCASVLAVSGAFGAALGSMAGKLVDSQVLLGLFGALMVVVAALMVLPRRRADNPDARLNRENLPALVLLGLAAGTLSGFFGIGGGFLVVPALVLATGMPMVAAIGSSLVAVTVFGLVTAISYASSGLVDWLLAGIFVVGGILGGLTGTFVTTLLARRRALLQVFFAVVLVLVAAYTIVRASHA